jgi:S1-C subfamily serine protease
MLVYDSLKPPAQNLTQDDIDQAVARTMASATPPPAVAALVAESISPSLVRIVAERDDPDPKKRFIIGTGIIVDDTGTILSALHIVQDAKRIEVTFWNGDTTEALIEVKQPANDIVVLRPTLPPEPLIPATLGNPNSVRPGDQVVVVGHPFGIVNSVTVGVVSGVHRSFKSSITGETITNTIQFDAAVNPGNSGGPLLNRYGEVIGVVSGLINPTEQNVFIGIGYAVPIQTAARAFGEPED